MNDFTEKQINEALEKIQQLDHETMCYYWRFAPTGTEIYFRSDLPTGKAFTERLFTHFGGFTPEISKKIGH